MSELTKRIDNTLKQLGISKKTFYEQCNITSAAYSQWNTEKTEPKSSSLKKVSDFLGVNYQWLLFGTGQKEKPATPESSGPISEDDIRAAFFRGADPSITDQEMDAMWDDAKQYLQFKLAQRRAKQENEK